MKILGCFGSFRNISVCFNCFDIGSKHRNKTNFFVFFEKRLGVVSVPCIVDNSNGFFLFILSLCRLVVFREHILVFFRKFWIVSVRFETVLFVSVVSIKVQNTKKNLKKKKIWFHETTETNAKQILFRFVSVRTEIYFCLFRGHPSWGRPNSDEGTHTVVLFIYKYYVR